MAPPFFIPGSRECSVCRGSPYFGERCSGHVTKEVRDWPTTDFRIFKPNTPGHEERSLGILRTGRETLHFLAEKWVVMCCDVILETPIFVPQVGSQNARVTWWGLTLRTFACWHNAWRRWVAVGRQMKWVTVCESTWGLAQPTKKSQTS